MAIEFYGGYQVYSESGVDLTLLKDNLRRSPEELWENNARGVAFVRALSATANTKGQGGMPMLDAAGIIHRLAAAKVEFVVIGGMAMRTHGSAHITEDLDVCYRRTPENFAALVAALAPLHPYLRGVPPGLPFRLDVPTVAAGLNFTLTTDLGPLDLLGEVSGIGDAEAVFAHSEEHLLFGISVRVLSLDALIDSKKAAACGKDHSHLLELVELKKLKETPPEG